MKTDRAAKRTWRGLRSDRAGVAAVEFALIFPTLAFLYLGSVDLCLGITLKRKVEQAASVMNDLATRTNNIKASELSDILDAGDAIVAPRASKLDTAKISGIYVDGDGKAKFSWSKAKGTQADVVGSAATLPTSLKNIKNANLVRTAVTYRYTPMGSFGLLKPFIMKKDIFAKARIGSTVVCSDC